MADKKLNKNKLTQKIRSAEQCFLVGNILSLVEPAKTFKVKPGIVGQQESLLRSLNRYSFSLGEGYYTNANAPVSTEEFIGNLFVGSEMQTFFDISEEEYSYLSPVVRLYRVDLAEKDKKKRIREFKFANFQNSNIINKITKSESDRVAEAGIQSCDWRLLGKNPASVDKMIEVDIKFFFSSIETLLYNGAPDNKYAPTYLDLIDRYQKNAEGKFKILLEVGYEIPDANINILDKKRAKELIAAIKKSNKVYLLNLKNHEIQFSQQGQIELNVSYIGSVENDMANIYLFDRTVKPLSGKKLTAKETLNRKKRVETAKKRALRQILTELKKAKPPETIKPSGGIVSFLSPNIRIQNPEYVEWRNKVRELSSILSRPSADKVLQALDILSLIDTNLKKERLVEEKRQPRSFRGTFIPGVSKDQKRPSILSAEVPIDELKSIIGENNLNPNLSKEQKKQKGSKNILSYSLYLNKEFLMAGPNIVIETKSDAYISTKLEEIKTKIKNNPQNTNKLVKELKELINRPITKDNFKREKVYFCYLGDLYDAIVDACIQNPKNADRKIEIETFLSLNKVVFGNITLRTYERDGTSTNVTISLSDLPVSYNFFNSWFIKNIVDTNIQKMPLWTLFTKFVGQLIVASVGMNCFISQDDSFKNFGRTKIFTSLGTLMSDRELFTGNKAGDLAAYRGFRKEPPSYKKIDRRFFESTAKEFRTQQSSNQIVASDKRQPVNYFTIAAKNQTLDLRQSNLIKDTKNGIFHFFLGRDNGIVKTINFSKASQKYQEEALLTTTSAGSKLDVYRRIYNVEIETFGNSAFIPGQVIYVDADTISKKVGLAGKLGLGGYYNIVDVSNSFSPGDFVTKIKGVFVGFGYGTDSGPAKVTSSFASTIAGASSEETRLDLIYNEAKTVQLLRDPNAPGTVGGISSIEYNKERMRRYNLRLPPSHNAGVRKVLYDLFRRAKDIT